LAYREGADEIPLLAIRFAVAAVLLAAFRSTRPAEPLARRTLFRLGSLGLVYGLEATLFFIALKLAPASVVSLIFYTYPLWTSVIAIASRIEPFRIGLVAALGFGTAGVAIIFSISSTDLGGPLIALAAAVSVAVYAVLAQVFARGVSPPTSATWTAAGAAVILGALSLVTRQGIPLAALPEAGGLGLATAVAFTMMYSAIARIGSARSAVAAMMEPVTTLVLAALVLGEALSGNVLLGAALIVSALPILALSGRAKPAAA
jgi:drug/metabolite transporter (DMT)-like permease